MQRREPECVLWTSSLPLVTARGAPDRKILRQRTIRRVVTHRRICQLCLFSLVGVIFFCVYNTNERVSMPPGRHKATNTPPIYNEHYDHNTSSQSLVHKHNIKNSKEHEESILDKMEYNLIKGIMRKILASHTRRLQSLGKVKEQPKPHPQEQPEAQPQEQTEPQPKEQPEAQPEAQPQEQPEAQPQEQPEAQPQEQTEPQPKEQPEAQPQEQPEAQPQEQPEAQPQEQPEAQPQEQPEAQPQEQPEAQPQEQPEPQPQEQPEPQSHEQPEPQPHEHPEPQPHEQPEPQPHEQPEPQPHEQPEPHPLEQPDPQPHEHPEPQPNEQPEPQPHEHPEPRPEGRIEPEDSARVESTTTRTGEETRRKVTGKCLTNKKEKVDPDQLGSHGDVSGQHPLEDHQDARLPTHPLGSSPQKILIYTTFFGRKSWKDLLGNRTDLRACPTANCVFTNDVSEASEADALIFHAFDFHPTNVPRVRHAHQRYIWLTHESPSLFRGATNTSSAEAGFFNWTSTYHRRSNIFLPYGGLVSLLDERNPARSGLLDLSGVTYRSYMATLQGDEQPTGSLEFDYVGNWSSFLSRPKTVAWMVSHCNTLSGRELYVKELQQYLEVDVYGACGPLACGKSHLDTRCYEHVLRPNYKFYLSFENNLCDDYITEKVWYPLHHGLVPVVYGGAQYHQFLPPGSYVDATNLTPSQLATLLSSVAASEQQYARYHLWRRFWQVVYYPPLCELCDKLHNDHTTSSLAAHPAAWWAAVNNCTTRYPLDQYPRKDLRILLYDLKEKMDGLGDVFHPLRKS